MKFVHSADWQIGMAAAHVGAAGDRVRAARLEACDRVIEVCRKESADFLLLAGDTFENNGVGRDAVRDIVERLKWLPCPAYIIPGNHDPLIPGSVWDHPAWSEAANVEVLKTRAPREIPGGALFPCPLLKKRSEEDPTAWIDARGAGGIRIGVAHGHASEAPNGDGSYPIALDAPARTGLDYLALGHWHSTTIFGRRMAYSGAHEQTAFGEKDSGNVLVVEIDGPSDEPSIRPVRTGTLTWLQLKETVMAVGALAETARKLANLPEPARTLIDLTLTGLLFQRDADELQRIEKACSRFLFARIDRSELRPAPEDEDWIEQLPAGAVRQAAARLRQVACSPAPEAEIATQALLELYAVASEVKT